MNYKIEIAKQKDLYYIHKLIFDRCLWFRDNKIKGWDIDDYPDTYNIDYFKKEMQTNKLYILKIDNEICGCMLLKELDSKYWLDNRKAYYIHHLTTSINKKGIGKILINFAIEQCKKDDKEFLRLDCYQTSAFLNDYYSKIGFTKVGSGIKGDYEYNLYEMKI